MSIDLSKLTPAPWIVDTDNVLGPDGETLFGGWDDGSGWVKNKFDADFIALARNAFDVMMRRKWFPAFSVGHWIVAWDCDTGPFNIALDVFLREQSFGDPFTTLVEADRWVTDRPNGQS